MVKLRYCAKGVKLFILAILLVLIWGAIWVQSSAHSLNFAKPWILSSLNGKDSPYSVTFDEVSIDWRSFTEFGKLHITHVTFSKREGAVFAQLPEIYATVDPLGFLPRRNILNKVILRGPHLFLTHSADGEYQFGFEEAESPMKLSELMGPAGEENTEGRQKIRLPFRDFVLSDASVNFYDEKSNSRVITKDLDLVIQRRYGRYRGVLTIPFTYEEENGNLTAKLVPNSGRKDYRLEVALTHVQGKLLCSLASCPEDMKAKGLLNADARLGMEPNGDLGAAWAHITTKDFLFTAPKWFEKPLKLGASELIASYDVAGKKVHVHDSKFTLEDTVTTLKAEAHEAEDGWYIEGVGTAGQLDVTKLYKYWPIALAPDSRAWVVSKLRSGHAAGGTARFHITPADIAKGELSDAALDADVDARDMSVDYLPGFPQIEHLNGQVHFTGTTVKIDGAGGTLLSGTKIVKALLWCPELMNPKNPMEATLTVDMPAADVAKLLEQPTFTFDDAAKLDAKTAQGNFASTLKLKFNAFSETKNTDPNIIHLDAVDYDINATIKNFAQKGLFGSYDVKSANGELVAKTASTEFKGVVALGDATPSDVDLSYSDGKPLVVKVKSLPPVAEAGKPVRKAGHDFTITYQGRSEIPVVNLEGKRFDGSASYGASENSILKDFPAIKLTVNLDELTMAQDMPFTAVKGTLNCSKVRCENAHFTALQGRMQVNADINRAGGPRQLVVTASDAGTFLKALDVTDRMTGGRLEFRGTYDDTKYPAPFNGRFTIFNFKLQNSQILGRILSIGSLTGLANALTGSGIQFDKMIANINARAGLITISDGRANGNAMGITVKGTVDTTTTKLALKGVVVPAYAINSMLGKIPIIGALAGGANEGLIAFNYSVGGTYLEPDVGVNPLSGLTPGFLRGIFGVFDQPASTDEKKTPAEPKSTPTNFNLPNDKPAAKTEEKPGSLVPQRAARGR